MQIFRQEHPKPQFMRSSWQNLNGLWQFEIDNGRSGEERGLQNPGTALSGQIIVPFCPESKLSGVEHKDFMYGVWYKRSVNIQKNAGRVRLHFGAVDYGCKVFVNGTPVGEHKGGYVSFMFDITDAVTEGENKIAVYAWDDTRDPLIPCGKQCHKFDSMGCHYTRTTGIWQTVWLEYVPEKYIEWVKFYPNAREGSVRVEAKFSGTADFSCRMFYQGKEMGQCAIPNARGVMAFTVMLQQSYLWEVGAGRLYDVEFTFGQDRVASYFGLRDVCLDGMVIRLNGKPVFQRLILDQGFYPDGIYTAPSDVALEQDIRMSQACGFNGARLHEKVFEERFLYHADRLGYIVWGEYPNWGLDSSKPESIYGILPEWMEVLHRDFNHPSIIGWCPYNEVWNGVKYDGVLSVVYDVTKAVDPQRPCIDTSGGYHVKSEIMDIHDYNQDPVTFRQRYEEFEKTGKLEDRFMGVPYQGEATFVSEYGGIGWSLSENAWGYGQGPESLEEFYSRFQGLTDALLDNKKMLGLCYTQLTDVEQEQNGLYTYDRKPKFDCGRLKEIMSRKAAIEE